MRDVEQERAGVLLLFLLAGDAASRKNSQADFGLEGFDTQNGKNPASTQNTGEGGFKQAQDTNNGPIVQDGSAETFGQIFGTQTDDGAKAQVSVDGQESVPSAENNTNGSLESNGDKTFGKNVRNYQVSEPEFSGAAERHMENPERAVPVEILKEAIASGYPMPDPRESSAIMYYMIIYKNGKQYNLEVLYDPNSNKIFHFEYTRRAIGPLPKIKK